MHVKSVKSVVLLFSILVWVGHASSREENDLEEAEAMLKDLFNVVDGEIQAAAPAVDIYEDVEENSDFAPITSKTSPVQEFKTQINSDIREATILLRFTSMMYSKVKSDPALRRRLVEDIIINLSRYTGVDPKYIRIVEIQEGSVIVKTTISFPEAVSTSRARELIEGARSSPEVVFTSGGFSGNGDFSVPEVVIESIETLYSPPPPNAVSTPRSSFSDSPYRENIDSYPRNVKPNIESNEASGEDIDKYKKFVLICGIAAGCVCVVSIAVVFGVMVINKRRQRRNACIYAEF